jgi:hypothetical protein
VGPTGRPSLGNVWDGIETVNRRQRKELVDLKFPLDGRMLYH